MSGCLGSGRCRRAVHVLGIVGIPFAAEHNFDNLFQLTGNPRRIGEDPPLLGGVELGLEVGTQLLVIGERSPISRYLGALGQFLLIRSGTRPGGQRLLG